MSSLQEGHQYSLSTEDKNNKSVIFVKLTDSAIQSIEQLFNSKNGSSSKPTIQFQNNSGIISLPQNGRKNNYRFTLSNIEGGGLQSGFQCLHHIDNSSLESMGFMFTKMQIHATEDSYEKTKSKMTAADQEQKNLCTKEIRQTLSRLGNKVSVKRPGLMYNSEKFQSSIVKPEPSKFNSKSKVNNHVTLIQQPIRERIIHILAAKPYKKAELLLRLKREGISDKDKDQINDILVEVAKVKGNIFTLENHIWNEIQEDWEFSSKEELDLIKKKKQQFIKSKNVNGAPDLSKPSVKQKNAPSTPEVAKKLCNKKQKTSFLFVCDKNTKNEEEMEITCNGNNIDKHGKRTSNLLTNNAMSERSNVSKSQVNQSSNCVQTNINGNSDSIYKLPGRNSVSRSQVKQSNNCVKTNINGNINSRSLSVMDKIKLCKELLNDQPSIFHENITEKGNKNNDKTSEISPPAESVPEFDFSEIQLKYTKIESSKQRSLYVKDFNDEYEEYLKLQTEMKEISEKFSYLFDCLNASMEESNEYQKIKIQIAKEYKKTQKNSYIVSRKRFEFLRAKLSHIREVILEYDKDEIAQD